MGHRINPIGLRLNIMQSWDSVLPSKIVYINDFFFKYFILNEIYGFFKIRWYSKLKNKFITKIIKKLQKKVNLDLRFVNNKKKIILYQLFFFKKFFSSKRAIRQKENKLFFYIYDIFINLNKQNLQIDYCYFQKIMGNINLKFIFKITYLESEFYNCVRFSQKWLKIKLFSLFFYKVEKYTVNFKVKNSILYSTLFLHDYTYKQNYLFYASNNFATSFYYLFSLFLNISNKFINYYLKNINFILYFLRKFMLQDLKHIKIYKNLNLEFLFNPFAYSSGNLLSKYLKYRLVNYESLGRIVNSFFFNIIKILKNMYKLKTSIFYCNYFLKKKKEKFHLMDSFSNFHGFIEIFGLKIFGSGRFTKKRRVRMQKFYKGAVPLNRFHKNITLDIVDIRLKYGIAGVKLWVYKAPVAKYYY